MTVNKTAPAIGKCLAEWVIYGEPQTVEVHSGSGRVTIDLPAGFGGEIDRIIGEMHEDGTLTSISEEWYEGVDLTTQE